LRQERKGQKSKKTGSGKESLEIIIIAAMSANRVIGRKGIIPWHIPEELQWFKAATMGHTLIMGRKTYESIGRPLHGRSTIVISRDPGRSFPGCATVRSLDQALALCTEQAKVFIAGGAQIYTLAMPLTDTIILSVLDQEVAGDTFFPPVPEQDFAEINRTTVPGKLPYTRITYRRRTRPALRDSVKINYSKSKQIYMTLKGVTKINQCHLGTITFVRVP
jgi:dihydrofolate reductase